MATFRYVVHGRVQGVGFRYFVMKEAGRLGVSGYARNLADGTVEVVAEGGDDAVSALEGRLRAGPAFASVTHVERSAVAPRGDAGFHIR